jgi:hypothetical protein
VIILTNFLNAKVATGHAGLKIGQYSFREPVQGAGQGQHDLRGDRNVWHGFFIEPAQSASQNRTQAIEHPMAPQRIPPAFSPSRSLFAAMSHGSLKQAMSDQIRCDRTSPELKGR